MYVHSLTWTNDVVTEIVRTFTFTCRVSIFPTFKKIIKMIMMIMMIMIMMIMMIMIMIMIMIMVMRLMIMTTFKRIKHGE